MARDHFIPAALLGRFSYDTDDSMRERRVWVYRPGKKMAVRQKAENVGYINTYYRLSGQEHARIVEEAWTDYEHSLNVALDQLSDSAVNSVDGPLWVRVLVPFVAGIFVRSPDFVRKYEGPEGNAIVDVTNVSRADNTNTSRLIAMTRSLAPIMAAKWTVFHTTGSEPLLINDMGYANNSFMFDRATAGWTIPIGPKCALQLTPCPDGHSRRIMFYAGKEVGWRAFIDHVPLIPQNHVGLNSIMSRVAHEFIAGPTQQSVERHMKNMGQDAGHTFNPQMWTSHRMQIVHEFEWYRLVRALQYAPEDEVADRFSLDFTGLDGSWRPPMVMLPTNLPEFQTGLRLRGRTIELAMSAVPGFTDYSSDRFPWEDQLEDGGRI